MTETPDAAASTPHPDGLPNELPERPQGWTKHLAMHMRFGGRGSCASYTIKDAAGVAMPFTYGYDTRLGGKTGFLLPDVEGVLTWAQLRTAWPLWINGRRAIAGGKTEAA